jgi:hypothetical protein
MWGAYETGREGRVNPFDWWRWYQQRKDLRAVKRYMHEHWSEFLREFNGEHLSTRQERDVIDKLIHWMHREPPTV